MRNLTLLVLSAILAVAQPGPLELGPLSASFRALSQRVNPSVVKVVAIGYRQLEAEESEEPGLAARQQSSGSGVVIDPGGYIVTNAHVVVGAQKVQVTLPLLPEGLSPRSAVRPSGLAVNARVIGLDLESDIGLLKIESNGLPSLKLADSEKVEQGHIVFAFGSPMGLDNSVSMGVVSSPARQLKPDDSMIFIQTDASINPGNSGGPLVNTEGEIVGINTLILTQSGGSEGLGFAVPSNIVANVVEQLRKTGKVVRGEIGAVAQTITPALAAGWKLPRSWGVVIADVEPDGPAQQAGLRVGDVITHLNGKPMENARQFNVQLYRPVIGRRVQLTIRRAGVTFELPVEVVERHEEAQFFAELASREENLIPEIGIFAVNLDEQWRGQIGGNRQEGPAIVVVARSADGPFLEENFKAGDLIYRVNQEPVEDVPALRKKLAGMRSGDAVAVQIERSGKLRFISFQLP